MYDFFQVKVENAIDNAKSIDNLLYIYIYIS